MARQQGGRPHQGRFRSLVVGPAHRGQFSGKLEVLPKGEPFPCDVPDCKKNFFSAQSQTPAETLPHGI